MIDTRVASKNIKRLLGLITILVTAVGLLTRVVHETNRARSEAEAKRELAEATVAARDDQLALETRKREEADREQELLRKELEREKAASDEAARVADAETARLEGLAKSAMAKIDQLQDAISTLKQAGLKDRQRIAALDKQLRDTAHELQIAYEGRQETEEKLSRTLSELDGTYELIAGYKAKCDELLLATQDLSTKLSQTNEEVSRLVRERDEQTRRATATQKALDEAQQTLKALQEPGLARRPTPPAVSNPPGSSAIRPTTDLSSPTSPGPRASGPVCSQCGKVHPLVPKPVPPTPVRRTSASGRNLAQRAGVPFGEVWDWFGNRAVEAIEGIDTEINGTRYEPRSN